MLRFACPGCQKVLQAPESNAGSIIACPHCQGRMRVPGSAPAVSAPAPAPQPVSPPPAPPEPAVTTRPAPVTNEPPPEQPAADVPFLQPLEGDPALRAHLPDDAPAKAYQLGELILTCDAHGSGCLFVIISGLILMFVMCMGLMVGSITRVPALGAIVVVAELGFVIYVSVMWCRNWWKNRGKRRVRDCLLLCNDGLIGVADGKVQCCYWNEVTRLYLELREQRNYLNGIHVSTARHYKYDVHGPDGLHIVFPIHATNLQKALDILEGMIVPKQLPRCWMQYNAGQTVDFDSIKIDQQGISSAENRVPWSQVRDVRAEGGFVTVLSYNLNDDAAPLIEKPLPSVANMRTLIFMTTEILHNRPTQEMF